MRFARDLRHRLLGHFSSQLRVTRVCADDQGPRPMYQNQPSLPSPRESLASRGNNATLSYGARAANSDSHAKKSNIPSLKKPFHHQCEKLEKDARASNDTLRHARPRSNTHSNKGQTNVDHRAPTSKQIVHESKEARFNNTKIRLNLKNKRSRTLVTQLTVHHFDHEIVPPKPMTVPLLAPFPLVPPFFPLLAPWPCT